MDTTTTTTTTTLVTVTATTTKEKKITENFEKQNKKMVNKSTKY